VQFRRGEYFFTRRKYRDAEAAYAAIISLGPSSSYYELALYKLGWTFYKQDFYEEALHRTWRCSTTRSRSATTSTRHQDEDDERRVADTFRVISLSFSNLGGPEVVQEYFGEFGQRGYEDRVYSQPRRALPREAALRRRGQELPAFVALYPFHRASPHFGMRVVDDLHPAGGFPKLVLESKKEFATSYGLQAEYWRHFDPPSSPEVLAT
jgi:cellulose synthase operon protein C